MKRRIVAPFSGSPMNRCGLPPEEPAHTIHTDDRPGVTDPDVWWAGNQNEVGIFWHGSQSAWLPAALLQKDQQQRLSDALVAASRHWIVHLHFNKGLAGAPPAAIAPARDTAMHPAVVDAFALTIIAGGRSGTYPGIPGHTPDLAVAAKKPARSTSQ
jgi:hypothetical protein